MREDKIGGFNERLNSQAEARRALLEKFKPKPMVQALVLETRAQRKAREIEEVRAKRAAIARCPRRAFRLREPAAWRSCIPARLSPVGQLAKVASNGLKRPLSGCLGVRAMMFAQTKSSVTREVSARS